jgi:hypothetical protein
LRIADCGLRIADCGLWIGLGRRFGGGLGWGDEDATWGFCWDAGDGGGVCG